MNIVSHSSIVSFYEKYPDSKIPLERWYKIVSKITWSDFNDLKTDFPSTDFVGNQRFVFNIGGNKFRLVVIIRFKIKHVFIRFIGTHSDYDKITDIKNI